MRTLECAMCQAPVKLTEAACPACTFPFFFYNGYTQFPVTPPVFSVVSTPATTCPICLDDTMTAAAKLTGCGHMFHPTCINSWLRTHATCPQCRKHVH